MSYSKKVFQYLMDDVNEWSTEYNVKVGSNNDLPESPHSWDKKVLRGILGDSEAKLEINF